MPNTIRNSELILRIIEDQEERSLEEVEIIHLLLDKKLSRDTTAEQGKDESFSHKAADAIAKFVGSWTFIITFIASLLGWILLNILLMSRAFDPFPFILLNLMLSCVAAIQAPIIMMSQNRQEEKDRLRAMNDYKTNLKSEIMVEELYLRVEDLMKTQARILAIVEQLREEQEESHNSSM